MFGSAIVRGLSLVTHSTSPLKVVQGFHVLKPRPLRVEAAEAGVALKFRGKVARGAEVIITGSPSSREESLARAAFEAHGVSIMTPIANRSQTGGGLWQEHGVGNTPNVSCSHRQVARYVIP